MYGWIFNWLGSETGFVLFSTCYDHDVTEQKYKRDTVLVYLDTSIPSFLIRDHRREPEIVEMQEVTFRLWRDKRFQFVISQRVIDEIQVGKHPDKVKLRLQAVEKLGILEITEEIEFLATLLLQARALPPDQESDAIHVAVATVNEVPYLVTWNLRHLANPNQKIQFDRVCKTAGYFPVRILTPKQLLEIET